MRRLLFPGTRTSKTQRRQHRLFRLESLEDRRVLESAVVFNELMYNALGDDGQAEWIELYNQLAVDIDISDWQLTGGVEYHFPDKTVVPGRGHLIVAADPDAFAATTGMAALGPWEGSLSNGGETLRLYNNDSRLVNQMSYDDENDWPVAADGTGLTLSKRNRNAADSENAENWTFSFELGGTPGQHNFSQPGEVSTTELLVGGSPVRAIVPTDDSLGMDWIQPEFDDSSWLSGRGAVGFDTRSGYNSLLQLDLDEPPNDQTPQAMREVNTSAYIRFSFDINNVGEEPFDQLELGMRYDDGFVAYLNGVEVAAENAPGRNGEEGTLAWNSEAAGTNRDSRAQSFEAFPLPNAADLLRPTGNVLAIHGLNRSLTDSDALWDVEIVGVRELEVVDTAELFISEVGGADLAEPFIELHNAGNQPIDLEGFTLRRPGAEDVTLNGMQLKAGQYHALTANDLGPISEGDRFVLTNPAGLALDGIRVEDDTRGRIPQYGQRWMNPAETTPGAANRFDVTTDVVINEIMYHPQPIAPVADVLPTFDRSPFLPLDWQQWRYNASGAELPEGWHLDAHAVDNEQWLLGQGPIGSEVDEDLGLSLNTRLPDPSENDPDFLTYYFQTDFELTEEQLADTDEFSFNYYIDDSAVFYLNGEELLRDNLPAGTIQPDTRASRTTSSRRVEREGPIEIPRDSFRVGNNTLSVELHLRSASRGDVLFGMELLAGVEATPLIPGSPYMEREELEWIELYNRGDEAIDLSDWRIDDAIEYRIPADTVIAPDSYLVIARDKNAFAETYPDVPAIGSFSGSLSNHDERIRLYDANDNLADEVHYYESGKWTPVADGGGSSLELIDASADNNRGAVWAASDHRDEAEWTTHTFGGVSQVDVYSQRARFNEFLFGLLAEGEFLIDDIQVIENPGPEQRSLLQNGSFEEDTIGQPPEKWRLIGNHSGTVVADPTDANNQVLHVVASGAQQFVHDHAETTFIDNIDIVDGNTYSISFRAKWLSGNNQLNSRLWFNRLPSTTQLDIPLATGTPGRANSTRVENAGPTYDHFQHSPVTPLPGEDVTVRTRVDDPDGIAEVTLWWRQDETPWNSVAMTDLAGGYFEAVIPGAGTDERDIIQFYVEATDEHGAASTFPAAGAESRALYQIEDGDGPTTPIDRFRLILMESEEELIYDNVNKMSNWYLPGTLVHNNTPYYDITLRLVGSRWIRPNSGYKVRLDPDQALYGIHDSVRFDLNGMAEIVMKQMMNRAGGNFASNYDDLGFLVVTARRSHSHEVIVQMARYENVFLDEQFEDGGDGTKWELDDVTVPNRPIGGVEGLKSDTLVYEQGDIGIDSETVRQQGDNPEFYRAHLLIKNNREKDDYQGIVKLAQAIHKNGEELFQATNEVMDVDLWMRHYANQSYFGNWDTYGFRRPKNLRLYRRPSDDKFIPLFWDCDLCNFTERIKTPRENTSRLDEIRDIPHNLRLFWGHMLDYINRSFNEEYVSTWASHYGQLVNNRTHGGDENFNSIARSTSRRSPGALEDLRDDIPPVDFQITTNEGNDLTVDTSSVMLSGKGWVDIRRIQLAGTDAPLDVFWPEKDGWQVELPLADGTQTVTLEAIDYQDNLIATDSITITSTAGDPVAQSLRISEIQYHPAEPSQAERLAGFDNDDDFEYIELTNVGSESIAISDVAFQRNPDGDGIEFAFSAGDVTQLQPGQSAVVVEDVAAFKARYGDNILVAGQWQGGLRNSSEQLTLTNRDVVLQQFAYFDQWHPATDGSGRALQVIDVAHPDLDSWALASSWRPTSGLLGSPGHLENKAGDVDGNNIFDSADLLAALRAGEYEDDTPNNSSFVEGDFNGDGDFTTSDLVWALTYSTYEGPQPLAAVSQLKVDLSQTVPPQVSIGDRSSRRQRINWAGSDDQDGEPDRVRQSWLTRSIDTVFGDEEFSSPDRGFRS